MAAVDNTMNDSPATSARHCTAVLKTYAGEFVLPAMAVPWQLSSVTAIGKAVPLVPWQLLWKSHGAATVLPRKNKTMRSLGIAMVSVRFGYPVERAAMLLVWRKSPVEIRVRGCSVRVSKSTSYRRRFLVPKYGLAAPPTSVLEAQKL